MTDKTFGLSAGDKFLLVGNMLVVVGGTCVGVGTILKLASAPNGLPTGKPIFTASGGSELPRSLNTHDVGGYFSI